MASPRAAASWSGDRSAGADQEAGAHRHAARFLAQYSLASGKRSGWGQFRAALRAGDFQRAMHFFVAVIVTDPDTGGLVEQFTRNLLRLPRDTILSTRAPDPDVDITPVLAQVKTPTRVSHGTPGLSRSAEHRALPGREPVRHDCISSKGRATFPIFTTTAEFCDVVRRFVRTAEIDPTAHRCG